MSTWMEFEDKGVENAVERACQELNIPKDRLKYDVISYGSTGIFGLVGTKKARIRVSVPEAKPERPSRRKKKRQDEPPAPDTPPAVAGIPEEAPVQELHADSSNEQFAQAVSSLVEEAFEMTEASSAGRSPEPVAEAEPAGPPGAEEATAEVDPEKSAEPEPAIDWEEAMNIGTEALRRIIDFITTEAEVTATREDRRILFNVQGGNAGILIGKKGQTLEAIQYIVEKIINRSQDQRIRVQVDIEGYMDNRRQQLESLAEQLSEKVKRTGKPVTIKKELNSHDRRIVHLTLKDDKAVRTQSKGDGFYRKLVIFPKRGPGRKKKKSQ